MPIIQVHHPAGRLDAATKADVARRLTDVLVTMEGGANTPKGRGFAWVMFHEIAAEDWWVGGRTDEHYVASPGRFLVYVTIPEGYMNAAHKGYVHAAVTSAIVEATRSSAPPSTGVAVDWTEGASILLVIDEVTEGNWGAAGTAISIGSIAGSVGLPKDGERFAWVRAYFAAKGRALLAAGYPADMGTVLEEPAVGATRREGDT